MDNLIYKLCYSALPVGRDMGAVTQRLGVVHRVSDLVGDKIESTTEVAWLGNVHCSAGIREYGDVPVCWKGVDAIVSPTQPYDGGIGTALTQEEQREFYNILLNHTPFGECIVGKYLNEAVSEGIVVDTHFPARLVAGTFMAQRLAWEQTDIARSILHYALEASCIMLTLGCIRGWLSL